LSSLNERPEVAEASEVDTSAAFRFVNAPVRVEGNGVEAKCLDFLEDIRVQGVYRQSEGMYLSTEDVQALAVDLERVLVPCDLNVHMSDHGCV
jgi:hypothetical protein